ncbi:class I SAM-dependent methyltransferase [Muriicola soli]|uniref:Class I SAM-dependent methyltransferase n=1 Tax=Muriicola soli TaxID=2507538 RepID=A0A411ECB5_9FLAO|nr:class I SAM-dependent methyltransferase [Muriicola soli]QBA65381.1 class I SAM-dependent methyltransferase [Muriicola soli]
MIEYLNTRDYSITQEEFVLMYDEQRELLKTEPQPDNLDPYYQHEEYISHTDNNKTFLEKIYQLVKTIGLSRKRKWLQKFVLENSKVLDVGAGTGSFVAYLRDNDFNAVGVEPSDRARKLASIKGVSLSESIDEIAKQEFDAITLWHVLEHFKDLDREITKLKERLKTGGCLFIAVPNFRSYDAKHYGEYWAAYDVPRHLWHFSRAAIQNIFNKKGFQLMDTKPMLFDSFYIALLSEHYKHGRKRWLSAIWHGLRSNLYGFRTGEYSSLVYILRKRPE